MRGTPWGRQSRADPGSTQSTINHTLRAHSSCLSHGLVIVTGSIWDAVFFVSECICILRDDKEMNKEKAMTKEKGKKKTRVKRHTRKKDSLCPSEDELSLEKGVYALLFTPVPPSIK